MFALGMHFLDQCLQTKDISAKVRGMRVEWGSAARRGKILGTNVMIQ